MERPSVAFADNYVLRQRRKAFSSRRQPHPLFTQPNFDCVRLPTLVSGFRWKEPDWSWYS